MDDLKPRLTIRPRRVAAAFLLGTSLTLLAPGVAAQDGERCSVEGREVDPNPAAVMAGRSGLMSCVRTPDGSPSRDFLFEAGKLVHMREWNDLGQRLDTAYHSNGAVRSRLRQVVYEGKPAWDREEFWDNGLLQLRGTFLEGGKQQGLVQTYHAGGPLSGEAWYDNGRLLRRKEFAVDGRMTLDEEFHADGKVKTSMQRF